MTLPGKLELPNDFGDDHNCCCIQKINGTYFGLETV